MLSVNSPLPLERENSPTCGSSVFVDNKHEAIQLTTNDFTLLLFDLLRSHDRLLCPEGHIGLL